ncbi:MAG: hypothetical protein M3065_12300 [Actinomycetota bacterium]|nr:hypothetical protein [Actinomycetota bacterium]
MEDDAAAWRARLARRYMGIGQERLGEGLGLVPGPLDQAGPRARGV